MKYWKNQFIVAGPGFSLPQNASKWRKAEWLEWQVWVSEHCNVVALEANETSASLSAVLIFGEVVKPDSPELSGADIGQALMSLTDKQDAFNFISELSGRFAVFFEHENHMYAVSDALGFKSVYFTQSESEELIFCSSPDILVSLIGGPQICTRVKQLIESPAFKRTESQWFGDRWYDERIRRLLPNHVWDSEAGRPRRFVYDKAPEGAYTQRLERAITLLRGAIQGVQQRHDTWLAVTAGYDSRVLLAASAKTPPRYYLFTHASTKDADAIVARKLTKCLGAPLTELTPVKTSQALDEEIGEGFYFPRELYKTSHIQAHINTHSRRVVNINGNGGEVARCFYGTHSVTSFESFYRHIDVVPFFKKALRDWYETATDDAARMSISVLDLFYWEQKMGGWGAQFPLEQDVAVEEFSPFSNRELLTLLLATDVQVRKPPHKLFTDLVQLMEPCLTSIPYNPLIGFSLKPRALKFLKKSYMGRLLLNWIKQQRSVLFANKRKQF